jgi:hypothetical protein
MRNLLAFLAAAGLTVAGVGWYRGWFTLQTSTQPSGHRNLSIDINSPKINEDLQRGRQYLLQGESRSPADPDKERKSEDAPSPDQKTADAAKSGEPKPAPKQ